MVPSIRKTAVNMLHNIEKNGAYVNIEMNKLRIDTNYNEKDIRLIGEIVNGVVKRKLTLDYVISLHSSTKLKKISPYVLNVLRVGVYQLLYMDKIPASAAVDECVKIIKKSSVYRLSGYVNALLRNVDKKDLCNLPSDIVEHMSIKYSFPLWIVKRWINEFGVDFTENLLHSLNKKSPLYVRCNTLVNSISDFEKALDDAQINYSKVKIAGFSDYNYSFSIDGVKNINKIPGIENGAFYIQDPTASLAAYILEPQKGDRIIDMCASPGGKSLFIADLISNCGEVISCDIFEHKIKLMEENMLKYKASCVKLELNDATKLRNEWVNTADRVLCDVPCSGFGIIRKKPDIKYSRCEEDIANLADLSYQILENGSLYLKNGGILVFSTCTIEKEENEEVIHKFLRNHPEFSIYPFGDDNMYQDGFYTAYPNVNDTDGFFICRLKKQAEPAPISRAEFE